MLPTRTSHAGILWHNSQMHMFPAPSNCPIQSMVADHEQGCYAGPLALQLGECRHD